MKELQNVESLIEKIWEEPLYTELTSKKVDVSIYKQLSQEIPDDFLILEEVFPREELEDIWNNYKSYLCEYEIFPFLGTLGEAVICIGYGNENEGKIYYFDFDFGCIALGDDKLEDFITKLK